MSDPEGPAVAFVSSYVPRQCGIATFTNDLATHLAEHVHNRPIFEDPCIQIAAMNDPDGEYHYGPQVAFEIRQHQRGDYRNAADFLNAAAVDVINLQHEYGLYGGPHGSYILEMLERLHKPVVTTCHTLLAEPEEGQRATLAAIAGFSARVIVLAERAHELCRDVYDIPDDKIVLIHHGTPDVEFHEPATFKSKFMVEGRPVILTFGLLGPGKGIEHMIEALAIVARTHPDVAYILLGATHPVIKRESGEAYRLNLESSARDLGIADNILFHNHYVSTPVLVEFLKAADVYVTPYRSKEQIVSGTLAFAVACGKAIVSTPYYYAQEMLADGRGRLADFDSPESLAENINALLDDDGYRLEVRKKAHAFGRRMVWAEVARQYDATYAEAVHEYRESVTRVPAVRKLGPSMMLPEVRLDHLYRLTDGTGILQHAVYSTPNRNHGYCTDDNARALIVAAMSYGLLNDPEVLPALDTYLSFLHYAWNPESRRFRNFMSYDRQWLDSDGTDDCLGRCLWAMGYLIAHPPARQDQSLAISLFRKAAEATPDIRSPRAQALCIIGYHYYLRRFSEAHEIQALTRRHAETLLQAFQANASPEWRWLEDRLTYNNARVPQALLLAGRSLGDERMIECGLEVLHWLLEVQTGDGGYLSTIGNDGWWLRGEPKPQFDQQPIEAAALTEACKSAYKTTGDRAWLVQMRRCFDWFMGRNDLGQTVADFYTRGSFDGLEPDGVNANEGAESTVCWLLAHLTMYEMFPSRLEESASV